MRVFVFVLHSQLCFLSHRYGSSPTSSDGLYTVTEVTPGQDGDLQSLTTGLLAVDVCFLTRHCREPGAGAHKLPPSSAVGRSYAIPGVAKLG